MILLPGREDRDIWAYFASLAFPPERQVRAALAALAEADRPLSASVLETRVDLSRGRLESMLKVLDVDGAVRRVSGGWTSTGQPWHYDGERYERVAAERAREQQAMLAYQATDGCRMEYLRRQLDDPAAAPCGRCDNCTGQQVQGDVPETSATAARERLLRPGVEVEPRRMWPTGLKALGLDVAGKIPATQTAEPGRAIGRLTDIGWGGMLRALLAEDAPDEPVTEPLVAAAIKVLAAWDWAQRPAGVLTLPSRTRPRLITSLGQRLASVGRLPYLGALAYTGGAGPGPRRHNSAQRLSSLWHALEVPDDVRAAVGGLDGPVLVVDDRIETGWTMTVAARLLREAGASGALPLALAVTCRLGDVGFGAVLADHGAARDGPAGHAVGDVDGVQAAADQRLGRVGRPGAACGRSRTPRGRGAARPPARRAHRAARAPRRGRGPPSTRRLHARQAGTPRPAGPPTALQARRRAGSWRSPQADSSSRPVSLAASLLYRRAERRADRGPGHRPPGRNRTVRTSGSGSSPHQVSAILARTSLATAASSATRPVSWGHQASDTEQGVRSRIGTNVTPGRLYQMPTDSGREDPTLCAARPRIGAALVDIRSRDHLDGRKNGMNQAGHSGIEGCAYARSE